jgi:Fic-DOC domain mobile mystery protein B
VTGPLEGTDPADSTPLAEDDFDGLRPTYITTRNDLNVAEQANIEAAARWAFRPRPVATVEQLLTVTFADGLHRRMFGDVWKWAGKRRQRATNIGVDVHQIVTEMKQLFDDTLYWHNQETFLPHEVAVRLHHRLVSVHPYRNGNGRHSRLMGDLYLHVTRQPPLGWSAGQPLGLEGATRRSYISALRAADTGDISPLLKFAVK